MQIAIERNTKATPIQPHQFLPPRQAITALANAAELVASAKGSVNKRAHVDPSDFR